MRRRTFLLTGLGATGALILGWSLTPPRQRLRAGVEPSLEPSHVVLNGWLAIAPDDTVTIIAPRSEMGQGIHTALAMMVAEELDCDWARVRTVPAPIDHIYNNVAAVVDGLPLHPDEVDDVAPRALRWLAAKAAREVGMMMTSASSSVRDVWDVARDAGATARAQLLAAAALLWNLPLSDLRTERGLVIAGDRQLRYGELVRDAAAQRPGRIVRKDPSRYTLIGHDQRRLDAQDAATGQLRFGMDDMPNGTRYAAVAMPPVLGSRPRVYDGAAARARPGVRAVVALPGSEYGDTPGVAVIADSWWQAEQALAALNVQWTDSPHAALSSDGIRTTLRSVARNDAGLTHRFRGDAKAALESASVVHEASYEVPYLAHATMEPPNATVLVTDSQVNVWTGTQLPDVARRAVAEVLHRKEAEVVLHQRRLGGGFGRRLEPDIVAQAARVAAAMPGTPVCTIWSRRDDLQHDIYRPACAALLRAGLDANGRPTAITVQTASQSPFKAFSRRVKFTWTTQTPDRTAAEGLWDQPYEWPALRVGHRELDFAVPVGLWRSVGHSHHAFFLESFVDELAERAGIDPLRYRLDLLRNHPRAARVLNTAAREAGWSDTPTRAPDGRPAAMGLALHEAFGTIVAQVATVSLSADRRLRVHRVVVAADCGVAVHPDGVRQQIEGGVVFGLTAALHGDVRIEQGRVMPRNFHEYPLLAMRDTPSIAVHLVPSAEPPAGVGEVGVPPIAPAVANAIARLTGERLRSLPLRPTRASRLVAERVAREKQTEGAPR
jgi:isoquinoline 1-oxidoreductase subunit beta